MTEPQEWAQRLERTADLPRGDAERFSGYVVMSLPFASGDVLALRRWPAASIGSAYTSVWHRSPEGTWTFYSDAPDDVSCPRYFSAALEKTVVTDIELSWPSARTLAIRIGGDAQLEWEMTLAATSTTRLLNAMGSAIPEPLWRQRWLLELMGRMAGPMLRAGRIQLHGHTPNHQWFLANPLLIWTIARSRASLRGRDFGSPLALARQANLADFWVPQRGLFAVARLFLEPFDPGRHVLPQEVMLAQA